MSGGTQGSGGSSAVFTEHFVNSSGRQIRFLEAGRGQPLVVLRASDALMPSGLNSLLAEHLRVIVFEIPGTGAPPTNGPPPSTRELARTMAGAAAAVGLDRYALMTTNASAPVALWQAIDSREMVEALVLISPSGVFSDGRPGDPELERALSGIKTSTLLLLGTEDDVTSPDAGRMYVRSIPNCYYVLVYDAGHAIEAARPDALFATVRDFLERRETFIVNRGSTVINP